MVGYFVDEKRLKFRDFFVIRNDRYRWGKLILGYAVFIGLYMAAQHIGLSSVHTVPRTWVDDLIPFTEWSIWIYMSHFLLMFWPFFVAKNEHVETRFFLALLLASIAGFLVFAGFQTTVPRTYQLSPDGLTADVFRFLIAADKPVNCFPSLHVAFDSLAAFAIWRARVPGRSLGMVWAFGITLSTMSTHQHVFIDVAGGFVLAVLCWMLSQAIVRRYLLESA
jgi:membrane-associated phospholipid phosphatase